MKTSGGNREKGGGRKEGGWEEPRTPLRCWDGGGGSPGRAGSKSLSSGSWRLAANCGVLLLVFKIFTLRESRSMRGGGGGTGEGQASSVLSVETAAGLYLRTLTLTKSGA